MLVTMPRAGTPHSAGEGIFGAWRMRSTHSSISSASPLRAQSLFLSLLG